METQAPRKRSTKRRTHHVPERTCSVCRSKKPKRELTRIVRTPEGDVRVDPTGKQNGRGTYICNDVRCWNRATTDPGASIARVLQTSIDPAAMESLRAAMAEMYQDVSMNITGQEKE